MGLRVLKAKTTSNEVGNPTVVLTGADRPNAGERILVLGAFYYFTGAAFAIEDDQGSTYTKVDTAVGIGSFVKCHQYLSTAYAGSGDCAVMINNANSPSNHYYTWSILALSGLLASPIDTPSLGTAQGNTSGTDANVACAAALAQARNHVIGVMSSGQGANGINLLPPSGYTDIMTEQNGTANQTGQIAHLQTNAISTPNLAWSHDDNGSSWIASVVAYKLAAASSGRKVGGGRLKSKVRGV